MRKTALHRCAAVHCEWVIQIPGVPPYFDALSPELPNLSVVCVNHLGIVWGRFSFRYIEHVPSPAIEQSGYIGFPVRTQCHKILIEKLAPNWLPIANARRNVSQYVCRQGKRKCGKITFRALQDKKLQAVGTD